jgi:hypothetical protein
MDMDMHYGYALWTCCMGMDTQHSFDNAACIWTMDMHGCRDPDKKFSPASLVFRLRRFVQHRHSGIMVSPVLLVTDQSVSSQLWQGVVSEVHSRAPTCLPGTDSEAGSSWPVA